jgi:hypothetical protein
VYQVVTDFRAGVDTRRHPIIAPPGTLRTLVNGFITAGGEIEKRKAFVKIADLPTTQGCICLADNIHVFGPGVAPTFPTVSGVSWTYKRFANTAGDTLLDLELFDGKVYTAYRDDATQTVYHDYDGVAVTGGQGHYVETFRSKIYGIKDREIFFSAVGDPTDWAGTGSGFINLSMEDAESFELIGLEVYYNKLAVMSRRATQFWNMDADPSKNQQEQVLRNTGTRAPQSVRQFSGGDVLYLDLTGIRSLRSKDSSLSASLTDVGSPVDSLVRSWVSEVGEDWQFKAFAIVEPGTGQYWLAIKDKIFVLSYSPSTKVSAWSVFEPGFDIAWMSHFQDTICLRDTSGGVYLYGGVNADEYDDAAVEIVLPYLNGDKPAAVKTWNAVDLVADGTWTMFCSFDPLVDAFEQVGTFSGTTFPLGDMSVSGLGSHIGIRLVHSDTGYARVSQVAAHFNLGHSG